MRCPAGAGWTRRSQSDSLGALCGNQRTAHPDSGVLLFFPVCNRHQISDTGSQPEDQEDSERHHDVSGQTATMVAYTPEAVLDLRQRRYKYELE